MTLSAQGSRLIETRVFAVVMVFSIVSGVIAAFTPYVSIILFDRFKWSAVEFGLFGLLLNSLQYLFSPILFFVVLYMTCGGPLLNRIASALMSLIFGSLVGYLIGSFIGSVAVAILVRQPNALYYLYYPISLMPQHVVAQMLMGFAVLAFSDMNMRWRWAVSIKELQKMRPVGVTLLAVLYVIFALLNIVAVPASALYLSIIGSLSNRTLVVIVFGVVFGMMLLGQLVVAAGLYYGKKWGWVAAVVSSASGLVIDIFALVAMLVLGGFVGMLMLLSLGSFLGLILSLAVLFYLLSINVRKFFGLVNPLGQVQEEPASMLG